MKKTELQAALAARINAADEISQLEKFGADVADRLVKEKNVLTVRDLQDKARLGKIIELQAVNALVPLVAEARENALVAAEESLLAVVNGFIAKTHGPRVRELSQRAEVKVRKELQPHFTETVQVDNAVRNSALVIEAANLAVSMTDAPVGGAIRYAEQVLELSHKADAFDKKLS